MTAKMFTVNWTAPVGFEQNFDPADVLAALRTARATPAERTRACYIASDLMNGEEVADEARAFLGRMIARHTSLLPSISDNQPGLHFEETGLDEVTAVEVTEPV